MKFDSFTYANGDVDVYKHINGQWELWVLVRDSYALTTLDTPATTAKGLYAAQPFTSGKRFGRYTGRILGRANDALTDRITDRLVAGQKGDALLTILGNDNGFVVDGRRPLQTNRTQQREFGRIVLNKHDFNWPGMFAHIMNDATDTDMSNNVRMTYGGYCETTRAVPAFDTDASLYDNRRAELLWPYGPDYHEQAQEVGTSKRPLEISEDDVELTKKRKITTSIVKTYAKKATKITSK